MSGYTPKQRIFRLRFEDPDYDGLVVRARSVPVGGLLDAVGLAGLDLANLDSADLDPETLKRVAGLFETFSGALVGWNLNDPETGEPVPATLAGVRSQDADFVMPIIKAWYESVAGVAGPLGPSSSAGAPSVPPPIPMEPRSASRVS